MKGALTDTMALVESYKAQLEAREEELESTIAGLRERPVLIKKNYE